MKVSVKNKIQSSTEGTIADTRAGVEVLDPKACAEKYIKDAIESLGQYCLQSSEDSTVIKESIANLAVILVDLQTA